MTLATVPLPLSYRWCLDHLRPEETIELVSGCLLSRSPDPRIPQVYLRDRLILQLLPGTLYRLLSGYQRTTGWKLLLERLAPIVLHGPKDAIILQDRLGQEHQFVEGMLVDAFGRPTATTISPELYKLAAVPDRSPSHVQPK